MNISFKIAGLIKIGIKLEFTTSTADDHLVSNNMLSNKYKYRI